MRLYNALHFYDALRLYNALRLYDAFHFYRNQHEIFPDMNLKHFLLWLPMILLAFANAGLRELVIIKYFDDLKAHQLSTITLIILCLTYVGIVFPYLRIQSSRQALLLGFVWMLLTVLFEFTLGLIMNNSWRELLQNYDLMAGKIWLVFLLSLFLMPYLFYKLKN